MKFVRIVFLSFTLLTVIRQPAAPKPSGAASLQNFIGSRSGGMAEAYSTVMDDVGVWAYNPATLATLTEPQVITNFSRGLAADYFSTLSYGLPTRAGTFAGSFGYYDTGSESLFAADGTAFDVHLQRDLLCAISYAGRAGAVNLGLSGKYLRSELAEAASAATFALDIGAMVQGPVENLSLGAAVRNVGPGLKFIEKEDPLPLELRFGASYRLPFENRRSAVLLSADFPYLMNERLTMVKLGAEYTRLGSLSLQAGYHVNSSDKNLTFGAGLLWNKIVFNYSLGLATGLSDTHRLAAGYRFGRASAETETPVSAPPAAPAEKRSIAPEIKKLLAQLNSPDWEKRGAAAFKLGKLKAAEAVAPLLELLDEEDGNVRGIAALALGRIGDRRAFSPLAGRLEDGVIHVRASAARALGFLGDKRALKPLQSALKDDSAQVRKAAADALKKLRKDGKIPPR